MSSAVSDFYCPEPWPCRPELLGAERWPFGHQEWGYGLGFQSGHLGAPLRRPGASGAGTVSSVGPRPAASDKALKNWSGSRPGWGQRTELRGRIWTLQETRPVFSFLLPLGKRDPARQSPVWLGWGIATEKQQVPRGDQRGRTKGQRAAACVWCCRAPMF